MSLGTAFTMPSSRGFVFLTARCLGPPPIRDHFKYVFFFFHVGQSVVINYPRRHSPPTSWNPMRKEQVSDYLRLQDSLPGGCVVPGQLVQCSSFYQQDQDKLQMDRLVWGGKRAPSGPSPRKAQPGQTQTRLGVSRAACSPQRQHKKAGALGYWGQQMSRSHDGFSLIIFPFWVLLSFLASRNLSTFSFFPNSALSLFFFFKF